MLKLAAKPTLSDVCSLSSLSPSLYDIVVFVKQQVVLLAKLLMSRPPDRHLVLHPRRLALHPPHLLLNPPRRLALHPRARLP